jgi:hypothetical protein
MNRIIVGISMTIMTAVYAAVSYQTIKNYIIMRYDIIKNSQTVRCKLYYNACEILNEKIKDDTFYSISYDERRDIVNNCNLYETNCVFNKINTIITLIFLGVQFYILIIIPCICFYIICRNRDNVETENLENRYLRIVDD